MWEKIWKDPVWSKVIATGIIAAVGGFGAYMLGYWPVVSRALSTGWNFIFASSYIYNWVTAILVLGSAPSVIILASLVRDLVRGKQPSKPNWTSYKQDHFFGLSWRWDYVGGRIVRLHAFCPRCDYQVFARQDSICDLTDRISFSCDSCHSNIAEFSDSKTYLQSKVERFIQQKIRNNTWHSSGTT